MKQYFFSFGFGLLFGLLFFFSSELLLQRSILSLNPLYHLVALVLSLVLYNFLPLARGSRVGVAFGKTVSIFVSLLIFSFGFFAPVITWFVLFRIALSNWTLF